MRPLSATIAIACSALLLAACGSEGVSVSSDASDQEAEGAEIFATHCAGCHTLGAAGTQGSGNRALRAQGPNFDQRLETEDEVLFAIRNGGFSGAIMPQNIVVGEDAKAVARFVAEYAGRSATNPPGLREGGGANEAAGTEAQGGSQQGDGGSQK